MSEEMKNGMDETIRNDQNNNVNEMNDTEKTAESAAQQNTVPDSSVNVGSSGNNSANTAGTQTGSDNTAQQNTNGTYQYSNPYSNSYGSNPTPNDGDKKEKKEQKEKKSSGTGKIVLAVVLAAAVGVGAGFGTFAVSSKLAGSNDSKKEAKLQIAEDDEEKTEEVSGDEASEDTAENSNAIQLQTTENSNASVTAIVTDVSDIVDEAMPSIVSVYNKYTETANYWGQTYSQEEEATGSGIIIGKTDDELLIATNNHVVDGADELSVQFIDDATASANIKGTDSSNDLAVIAVSLDDIDSSTMDEIKIATIGDSDKLAVGDAAIAIGNALGYGQSVTTGVISALNREITDENNNTNTFIQTDAAINPGNSGGALLNDKGEVIGINSSKIGATTVEGMGYAIPMARAIPIIENLMNQETKTKLSEDEQGYLGIQGVSVTAQIASAYDMPEGVYVAEIIEGSGAADSDLTKGDIITGINGTDIASMDELKAQLVYYGAGKEITLTVQRASDGNSYEEKEVTVTLGDKSTLNDASSSDNGQNGRPQNGDDDADDENENGGHSFGFFSNDN